MQINVEVLIFTLLHFKVNPQGAQMDHMSDLPNHITWTDEDYRKTRVFLSQFDQETHVYIIF